MKAFLAALLCAALILSAFCGVTAYAEEIDDSEPLLVPKVEVVTAEGNGLSLKKADGYVDAAVTVTDTDGSTVGGDALFKVRGNSTSGPNKKPFTVKFNKKTDVLGMGKAKKWALLAHAFDPTLLRNYVAIDTAAQLGLDYTSQQRIVELWVDGSFRGCYLLIEPIQKGETRVDIDIESNDGKNDFLIEREYNRVEEGEVYFKSNGIRFVCGEPETPDEEQLAYIKNTVDHVFSVLKTGTRQEIEATIDVPSFAKYYLLNEFVKTVDVDYSSVFFYYKDGKLYAGPAWDYDLALGNEDPDASANYAAAHQTDGLYCNNRHFYKELCKRDWFFDEVYKVYLENGEYLNNVGAPGGLIESLYEENAEVIDRNFTKAGWRVTTYFKNFNFKPYSTYAENLEYFRSWCSDRAAWLEGYYTEDIDEYMLGDSDRDDEVAVIDVTIIQRSLADMAVVSFDATASDVDGDGDVTIVDATGIQRFLCEMETSPEHISDMMVKKASAE